MRVTKWFSGAGLLILALAVLCSTLFTDWAFKGLRFDLTQGHMYTLSDGTKHIVRNLNQPVDLYFYFSKEATRDAQAWRSYAKQVQELLEEFTLKSNGKLRLHVIDPEPFSEEEDQAAAYGLEPANTGQGGDKIYFGLVAKVTEPAPPTKDGKKAEPETRSQVISMFQYDRQEFLEYDIAKLIYEVSRKSKPKIALFSSLDLMGGFNFMTRSPTAPWAVMSQLEQLFQVKKLTGAEQEISPKDYQLLLVVHPRTITDSMKFAIDQYVLRGGHALIFVDPYAEQDHTMGGGPDHPSDLKELFKAWGVDYDPTKFVGDEQLALQVGMGQGMPPVRHLGILRLTDKNMPRDNLIVGKLETIHVSSAGFLKHDKDSKTTFEPLLYTSKYAAPIDAKMLSNLSDPRVLEQGFNPTGEVYTIAAHITGNVKSAFPDGPPKHEAEAKKDGASDADLNADEGKKTTTKASSTVLNAKAGAATETATTDANATDKPAPEYLKASKEPINVVVVADTDILSDRLWVHARNFFGQKVLQPFADNGDLFYNSVDVLSGSSDLISIRSRGRYFRPFTVVRDMQRKAEANFQQVEQALTQRLQDIEVKLSQLHQKQGNGNQITLTPDMQKDLVKFEGEKLKIRKQLREVQHQLNKDIDKLDFELKVINIAGIPLLLTLLVIGIAIFRRKQAHSD